MLALTVKTSNPGKMKEMRMAGIPNLSIEPGEDLPEIQSNDFILVAAYKAQSAGNRVIIEDSIISINDDNGVYQPVVDVKFKMAHIKSNIHLYAGKKALFISTVAVKIDDKIYVQTHSLECSIQKPHTNDPKAFGFDDILHIEHDGSLCSLHFLKNVKNMNPSPRLSSLKKLFNYLTVDKTPNDGLFIYDNPLPHWIGEYQE